jgi:hypothetical protein
MLRRCASFAATGLGNERATLVVGMGLMNVDTDDKEAVSGRMEDMSAKRKKTSEVHKAGTD